MRKAGPIILIVGLSALIFSFVEFFTLDSFETPKYFWMSFVGMPLIFIGFVLSGPSIQQYLLKQNKETLRETMIVMGEGLREGLKEKSKYCTACGNNADQSDKYCSKCGELIQE